ncbi:carbonic anhydrase [Sphingomonas sp. PB2P12]|uniref:carbonic anhydrase n=1 Tax=Sphingomonas sandaracina TaxID=3096157 RepID=UPI002FCC9A88
MTVSRRDILTTGTLASAAAVTMTSTADAADTIVAATPRLTPDEALRRLKDGNAGFVADRPVRSDLSRARRLALAEGQQPFATLVGCSDSRVGPEQLFGAGLGELFIVRTAGNNVDTAGMGSIEYSVTALGVPLVVVLGHEKCGAVAAAVDVVNKDVRLPGSIGRMIEPIIPSVLVARRAGATAETLLNRTIDENVRRMVDRLRNYSEPMLLEPQRQGKLKVVGAVYSLATGLVRWL